jgi:hypothetical protein
MQLPKYDDVIDERQGYLARTRRVMDNRPFRAPKHDAEEIGGRKGVVDHHPVPQKKKNQVGLGKRKKRK